MRFAERLSSKHTNFNPLRRIVHRSQQCSYHLLQSHQPGFGYRSCRDSRLGCPSLREARRHSLPTTALILRL
jgi:hypothetical protein